MQSSRCIGEPVVAIFKVRQFKKILLGKFKAAEGKVTTILCN